VLVLRASSAGSKYSGSLPGKPWVRKASDTKPAKTANEALETVSSLRAVQKSRCVRTGCSTKRYESAPSASEASTIAIF
jgi:hypothetical protein